MTFDETIRRGV